MAEASSPLVNLAIRESSDKFPGPNGARNTIKSQKSNNMTVNSSQDNSDAP